jgi:O-acetyl-ADP-ribose deacetylase (regulator of RNase III)
LAAECSVQQPCPVGGAAITQSYGLPAVAIIHAVGPRLDKGEKPTPAQAKLLGSSHESSLRLCDAYGLASIAFPRISTGIFHYPLGEAGEVTAGAILRYFRKNPSSGVKDILICILPKKDDSQSALDDPYVQAVRQTLRSSPTVST